MRPTAKLIGEQLPSDSHRGHWKLYEVNPPAVYEEHGLDKETTKHTHYVIASAVCVPFTGDETYIFPANSDFQVESWEELPGSQRGTLSHEHVMKCAGYDII